MDIFVVISLLFPSTLIVNIINVAM